MGDAFSLFGVAPARHDVFAVVAITDAVRGEILPEIAAGRLAGVGQFVFHGNSFQKFAFGVVGMFVAAIADGNGLGDVIGNGRRSGPDVAVAGNFAAIVEVVEHAKLLGQRVLVRSDVRAIHGDGRVAVADAEIAEDLIVGAVFLDDVNHVADFVFAGREGNAIGIAAAGVTIGEFAW